MGDALAAANVSQVAPKKPLAWNFRSNEVYQYPPVYERRVLLMNMNNGQYQRLFEIIPDNIFIGTSLILRQGDRFLYGIRPIQQEKGHQILELTGIGGGLENEDKSLSAGAIREAREEIGCGVNLISCPTTPVVRNQNDVEQVTLEGDEHPAAVVF